MSRPVQLPLVGRNHPCCRRQRNLDLAPNLLALFCVTFWLWSAWSERSPASRLDRLDAAFVNCAAESRTALRAVQADRTRREAFDPQRDAEIRQIADAIRESKMSVAEVTTGGLAPVNTAAFKWVEQLERRWQVHEKASRRRTIEDLPEPNEPPAGLDSPAKEPQ